MSFRITISEVNVEDVVNGKNRYSKATVNYTSNGQRREQKIMSFTNPAVFALVRNAKAGEVYDVEITKNDQGYNQWAAAKKVEEAAQDVPAAKAAPKTNNSWESAEERAKKQVLIVKQSCLAQAVAAVGPNKDVDEYRNMAQDFVDWVMADDSQALDGDISTFSEE